MVSVNKEEGLLYSRSNATGLRIHCVYKEKTGYWLETEGLLGMTAFTKHSYSHYA